MSTSHYSIHFAVGLSFALALLVRPAHAEQLSYVPLAEPCRLLDTRTSSYGPGPLTAAHGVYLFGTASADISSASQNGNSDGCRIPDGVAAISVNMNMLSTTASGNISTWSADTGPTAPNIGTGVYNPTVDSPAAGQVQFNTGYTTVPVGSPGSDKAGRFYLRVANGQLDMTMNVVGYWLPLRYMAGTGLNLNDFTFSVAPTYRLPQSCTANQIPQWDGTAWTCGSVGPSYTAGTGLALSGTSFSIAPTYQLPQSCAANQVAQWDGTAWGCASTTGTLPAGTVNQTLRYDASNALVANNFLQAFGDGGLLAGGAFGTGGIPASGKGIRTMWYPAKAAFRTGSVDDAQWDDANIGVASTATGRATTASGFGSTATGGFTIASGDYSLAMGYQTIAAGEMSTATGINTDASGRYSTAIGAATHASGAESTAMGSVTTASGFASMAMGRGTTASGDYSTAIGRNVSTNSYSGSFIYGDASSRTTAVNTADNQFVAVASGGVYFFTSPDRSTGVGVAPGGGSWFVLSDRNAKTAVQPVDGRDVLKKVAALPLNTWQYKAQDEKYRHMGPMAQDFYSVFHLGESDKFIDMVDADGVALAAIQGLNAELVEKNREISALHAEITEQAQSEDKQIAGLRSEMTAQAKSKDAEIAALHAELSVQKAKMASQEKRFAALESLAGDVTHLKAQLAALRQTPSAPMTVALTQP